MDENNQSGNAMTEPLPTSSIKKKKKKKKKKILVMREFDLIIKGISDEDKIGHLFVVDIHFDQKNNSEKQ